MAHAKRLFAAHLVKLQQPRPMGALIFSALLALGATALACASCGGPPAALDASLSEAQPLSCETGPNCSMCNSLGRCTPEEWFCGPMYYNGGAEDGCDCDCGAPDPDCDNKSAARWCYNAGQPLQVDSCAECTEVDASAY